MIWPFRQRKLAAEEQRADLASEEAVSIFIPDADKISVEPGRSALKCVAVYTAITTLADIMASLSVHLYQRTDAGKERDEDHPAEAIMAGYANGWTTAVRFRKQMTVDLMLHGNAYGWIGRDGTKKLTELLRFDPKSVTVERDPATQEPVYKVREKGNRVRTYGYRDILHLRGISVDDLKGESPITLGKEAIRLALVLEQHGINFFENGARSSGVVRFKKKLGLVGIKNFLNAFREQYAGTRKSGTPIVLDEGSEFDNLSLTSADSQYLELRRFAVLEIARLFRLPPHFLAELERTTHSNAEEMGAQLVTYCILPLAREWESELSLKLLTDEERKSRYFEFMLDTLARASLKDRFEAFFKAVGGPWMTADEARAADNRGSIAGGNVLRAPLNTAPANTSTGDPANEA